MNRQTVENLVGSFQKKNEIGFNKKEIETLLTHFPNLNKNKFDNALFGVTAGIDEEEGNGILIYNCDIITAIMCGLENRDLKWYEWD